MTTDERDRLGAFALRVWGYKQGEVVSLMVHLGDRLGLYRAMAGQGPMTAAELAERDRSAGTLAAGVVARPGRRRPDRTPMARRFDMSPEAVAVLADDDGKPVVRGRRLPGGVAPPEVVDRLADAFRTGIGLTYDDLGPSAAHAVERMLEPWTRLALVPLILPALDGVGIGCWPALVSQTSGAVRAWRVTTLAAAFPRSRFDGLDPSRHAIDRARDRAAAERAGRT